jgi:DNA-binding IclR family transcriptional regulator
MSDDRDDEGRFREEYPDEAFLQAIDELEVASTQNVADEVGCSYDLAYRRLRTLNEKGRVRQDQVGSSFLWLPA